MEVGPMTAQRTALDGSRLAVLAGPAAPWVRRLGLVCSWIVLLGSAVTLLGWALDNQVLMGHFLDAWPVTRPWTAVIFGVLAVAALGGHLRRRWAAAVFGIAGAIVAVLALESLGGWTSGPSGWLFADRLKDLVPDGSGTPAGLTLVMALGLAVGGVLIVRRRAPFTRTALIAVADVTATLVGIGFALGWLSSGRFSSIVGVSAVTAVWGVLLVASITSLQPIEIPAHFVRVHPFRASVFILVAVGVALPVEAAVQRILVDAGVTLSPATMTATVLVIVALTGALMGLAWTAAQVEQWSWVAEAGADAIILVDGDGIITRATAGVSEVTGWPASDLVGRAVAELLPHELRPEHGDRMAGYFEWGESRPMMNKAVTLHRRDGSIALVDIRLVPLATSTGTVAAAVIRSAAELDVVAREAEHYRELLTATIANSELAWAVITLERRFLEVNESFCRMTGYSRTELIGMPTEELAVLGPGEVDMGPLADLLEGERSSATVRRLFRRKDGALIWVECVAAALRDKDGSVVALGGQMRDITEAVRAEDARLAAEESLRLATEQAVIGQAILDLEGRITRVNDAFARLLQYPPWELVGRTTIDLTHPDDRAAERGALQRLLRGEDDEQVIEKRYLRSDGSEVWVRKHRSLVRDTEGRPHSLVAQVEDLTSERRARERQSEVETELRYRSTHDLLTGLQNRTELVAELDRLLAGPYPDRVTALFIDIDSFKRINDGISHRAGDDALITVSDIIQDCVRSGDVVGRLGGDEFVVVLAEVADHTIVEFVTNRIRAAVADREMVLDGQAVRTTVSIGSAPGWPGARADDLLREADTALHRAKERGRDRWEVFDDRLRVEVSRRMALARQLRGAIDRGHIKSWFQPVVDLRTGETVGYEALARWVLNDSEVLLAGEFISVAEGSGLLVPLGEQVISQAIDQLAILPAPVSVSINAAPTQMSASDFDTYLLGLLDAAGADPHRLIVEVTETELLQLGGSARRGMHRLADAGVRWHLDDFGTGYSSISVLQDHPIAGIKLDLSFTSRLGDPDFGTATERIVAGLADLGTRMGLERIAEGVEQPMQASMLVELGWPVGQGWLYGAAAPLVGRSSPASA